MEKILNYTLSPYGVEPDQPMCGGTRGEHKATALVLSSDAALGEAVALKMQEGTEVFVKLDVITEACEFIEGEERPWENLADPFFLTTPMTASGLDAVILVRLLIKNKDGSLIGELYKAQIKLFFEDALFSGIIPVKKPDPTKALEETAEAALIAIEQKGNEVEQKIDLKLEKVTLQTRASAEQLKKVMAFASAAEESETLARESQNSVELAVGQCESKAEEIGSLVHDVGVIANNAALSANLAKKAQAEAENCVASCEFAVDNAEQNAKEAAEAGEESKQNALSAKQSRDEAEELLRATEQQAETARLGREMFANALKAKTSGMVLNITGVSPLEHNVGVNLSSDTLTDFSGVKVTVGGINLFDISKVQNSQYLTNNGDGTLTVSGIYGCGTGKTLRELCPSLKVGDNLSLRIEGEGNPTIYLSISKFTWTSSWSSSHIITEDDLNSNVSVYGQSDKGTYTIKRIWIYHYTGVAQPYEPYIGHTEYTANADGTVDGVKSIYPSMSLKADTEGVIINAEYNRDINKAFAELTNALISLGGEI